MKDNIYMFKLFVRYCLLFNSKDKLYWLLGILGWGCLALFAYALSNLFALNVFSAALRNGI